MLEIERKVPENRLTYYCCERRHDTIQRLCELDEKLDKIWELQNAFDRKCSFCVTILMLSIDFEAVAVLYFETDYKWTNVPKDRIVRQDDKLCFRVPLIYAAIYTEMSNIVRNVIEDHPRELVQVFTDEMSLLQFSIIRGRSIDIVEYLLRLPEVETLLTTRAHIYQYSDLLSAFIHPFKYTRGLVETFLTYAMKLPDYQLMTELELVLHHVEKENLHHLDPVLRRNRRLLTNLLPSGYSFAHILVQNLQIDILKELHARYNLDLTIRSTKGKTIFYTLLRRCRRSNDQTIMNYAVQLLNAQTALAHIPCDLKYEMPVIKTYKYGFRALSKLLMNEYRADVDAKDSEGKSILYYAFKLQDFNILEDVLSKGADVCTLRQLDSKLLYNPQHISKYLQYMSQRVVHGICRFDVFTGIIACFHIIHGARLQNLPSDDFYVPLVSETWRINRYFLIKNYEKVCALFKSFKLYDFDKIVKKKCVDAVQDETIMESFYYGFEKLQEFTSLDKDYGAEYCCYADYKRIRIASPIQPLGMLCRHTIRALVMKNIDWTVSNYQEQIDEAFNSLPTDPKLKEYLIYERDFHCIKELAEIVVLKKKKKRDTCVIL